jgi:hypothetical protein
LSADIPEKQGCGGRLFKCSSNAWEYRMTESLGKEHIELMEVFLKYWQLKDEWAILIQGFTNQNALISNLADKRHHSSTAAFISWIRYWISLTHCDGECPYFKQVSDILGSSARSYRKPHTQGINNIEEATAKLRAIPLQDWNMQDKPKLRAQLFRCLGHPER